MSQSCVRSLPLLLALTACAEAPLAAVSIGTTNSDGATSADGAALGDGAIAGDGGTAADGATIAPDGAVLGPDGAVISADAARGADGGPALDSGGAVSDTSTPPDSTPADVKPLSDTLMADGATAKYTTCTGLLTCVQLACGEAGAPGCDAPCTSGASEAVSSKYGKFSGCMAAVGPSCTQKCPAVPGKPGPDSKCVNDCGMQSCGVLLLLCVTDGKTGDKPCSTAFTCQDTCKDNFTCVQNCYASMTAQAQAQTEAFGLCVVEAAKKGITGDKAFGECIGPLVQCMAGGAKGSATCSQAFDCYFTCSAGGGDAKMLQCLGECYGKSNLDAQSQFLTAFKCMATQTAKSGPFAGPCSAPVLGCLSDFKSGAQSCAAVSKCAQGCNFKTTPGLMCMGKCYADGTKDGQKAWAEFMTCDESVSQSCLDGLLACAAPSGTKSCTETMACMGTCKENATCFVDCVTKGTSVESKEAVGLFGCAEKNKCKNSCEGKPEGCMLNCFKTKCAATYDACLK
ncbi:MAG: hypothetical protein EXR79_17225 [Myxococcales bacterium]|nr:hypothetical protein [Myxococcales bacterium]